MKKRPILFNPEMVRAILEGRKTQTRRLIKMRDGSLCEEYDIPAYDEEAGETRPNYVMDFSKTYPQWKRLDCPKGHPGDVLWVREKWNAQNTNDQWWHEVPHEDRPLWNWAWTNPVRPAYDAVPPRWLPSIHMPKAACRIMLEIVSVKVERVKEITPEDAQAEGCFSDKAIEIAGQWSVVTMFKNLWNSINGTEGKRWEDNPWVWVVEFKVI